MKPEVIKVDADGNTKANAELKDSLKTAIDNAIKDSNLSVSSSAGARTPNVIFLTASGKNVNLASANNGAAYNGAAYRRRARELLASLKLNRQLAFRRIGFANQSKRRRFLITRRLGKLDQEDRGRPRCRSYR